VLAVRRRARETGDFVTADATRDRLLELSIEIADLAGSRVNHVHLKDVDLEVAGRLAAREFSFKEAAQKNAFRPLGDGDVDVGGVVDRLESSDYTGWYVLEQDSVVETKPDEGEGPVVEVRKSLDYLREKL